MSFRSNVSARVLIFADLCRMSELACLLPHADVDTHTDTVVNTDTHTNAHKDTDTRN